MYYIEKIYIIHKNNDWCCYMQYNDMKNIATFNFWLCIPLN